MKKPWEWNEDDLLGEIAAGWKESIDLDFKQSDALQNTDGKRMRSARMFQRLQIPPVEQSFTE